MIIEIIGAQDGDVVNFSVAFGPGDSGEVVYEDYSDEFEDESDADDEDGDQEIGDATPILGGDAATDAPVDSEPADEPDDIAATDVAPVVDEPAINDGAPSPVDEPALAGDTTTVEPAPEPVAEPVAPAVVITPVPSAS